MQTVYKDSDSGVKQKTLIWFKLDLSDLTKVEQGPAPVDVVFAGPISKAPAETRTTKGTTVILRHLHERKARNADSFHHSMAQRFLLIGSKFRVRINDEDLREEDIQLQWREPKKTGWATDARQGKRDH